MAFWSDPTNFDPKRKYNWILILNTVPTWIIKKVTKPGFATTEAVHRFLNYSFYYPGKIEWDEIEMTLVDPVVPDAAKSLMDHLRDTGYNVPGSPKDLSTISKKNATNVLGQVSIQQLGHGPVTAGAATPAQKVIEEWHLKNAWIKNVKFGDLDYEADDLNEITVTLRYDWAELNKSGTAHPRGTKKQVRTV